MAGAAPQSRPAANALAGYAPADPAADLYASAPPEIAQRWRALADGLIAQGGGDAARLQVLINRQVDDLGLAFRVPGEAAERRWALSPLPLLIGADEWRGIEAGLIQRADLLESVAADIYGPARLIAAGHLPAAAITGSANYMARMAGLKPAGGHFLSVIAIDLARGPGGAWRVLADRLRLPIGIGYAHENRLALARASGALLPQAGVLRLSDFYETIRAGIAAHCARSDPRIALLTPGRYHQSYAEQAHLARALGFALVEGGDLMVSDARAYVRTIAGLKRIDALWRWIGTRDIDPLAFDSRSGIGVADLATAWSEGGLVMANWPGVGVLESRAMAAFLPRLAQVVLAEPLALPNVATWWCGQPEERAHVLANLDKLVISSAFRAPAAVLTDGRTRPGASLDAAERAALIAAMAERPMDYAGQEVVRLSTTPCLSATLPAGLGGSGADPRPFTLRAYLARGEDGRWVVMPGGFARLSLAGDLRTALMGAGDIAADVCIVETARIDGLAAPLTLTPPPLRRGEGLLPSRAADNLFWLGRYVERAQMVARIVRVALAAASTETPGIAEPTVVPRLADLLTRLGALPRHAAAASIPASAPSLAIAALTGDSGGALPALINAASMVGGQMRDRLTPDAWRLLTHALAGAAVGAGGDNQAMLTAADRIVERFAAFHQLLADAMSRTPAWRFLAMGRAIERAALVVQAADALIPGSASGDDLGALLALFDGEFTYRARYLTIPYIAPVLDLILLDSAQPRSLAHQAETLARHLAELPVLVEDGMIEPPLRRARALAGEIAALDPDDIGQDRLAAIAASLGDLSDAIADRYFHQAERAEAAPDPGLLA